MATIKVKCNGPGHHINEIDLDRALRKTPVARGTNSGRTLQSKDIPERIVLPCHECTIGKVIITREMIAGNL